MTRQNKSTQHRQLLISIEATGVVTQQITPPNQLSGAATMLNSKSTRYGSVGALPHGLSTTCCALILTIVLPIAPSSTLHPIQKRI